VALPYDVDITRRVAIATGGTYQRCCVERRTPTLACAAVDVIAKVAAENACGVGTTYGRRERLYAIDRGHETLVPVPLLAAQWRFRYLLNSVRCLSDATSRLALAACRWACGHQRGRLRLVLVSFYCVVPSRCCAYLLPLYLCCVHLALAAFASLRPLLARAK
jgi:hypothetical protein